MRIRVEVDCTETRAFQLRSGLAFRTSSLLWYTPVSMFDVGMTTFSTLLAGLEFCSRRGIYFLCQGEHGLPGHICSPSVVAALPWDVCEGYTFKVGVELRHSRVSKIFDRSARVICIGSVYSRTRFRTTLAALYGTQHVTVRLRRCCSHCIHLAVVGKGVTLTAVQGVKLC